jgi:hypothetical protein
MSKRSVWSQNEVTELQNLIAGGCDIPAIHSHFQGKWTLKQVSNKCTALRKAEKLAEKNSNKRPSQEIGKSLFIKILLIVLVANVLNKYSPSKKQHIQMNPILSNASPKLQPEINLDPLTDQNLFFPQTYVASPNSTYVLFTKHHNLQLKV